MGKDAADADEIHGTDRHGKVGIEMKPLTREVYHYLVDKVNEPYLTISRICEEYCRMEKCSGEEKEERREGFKLALMNIRASLYKCAKVRTKILHAPLRAK